MKVDDIYQQNLEYRKRKIGDRNILFGQDKCYDLNETAEMIWTNLDGFTSLDEIILLVVERYQQSYDQIKGDVFEFMSFLIEINAVGAGMDDETK